MKVRVPRVVTEITSNYDIPEVSVVPRVVDGRPRALVIMRGYSLWCSPVKLGYSI